MAQINCNPKLSHPMYGYGKQDKSNVVIARVSEGINYLTEKSTRNYSAITKGTLGFFDPTLLPPDMIRCNEAKCHMSGTLWITPNQASNSDLSVGVGAKYQIRGDYTAAAFGMHYLYLTYMGNDTLKVTAKVSDYEDYNQVNSYSFTDFVKHNTFNANDFVVAQFDFADPSKITSQTGSGWQPGTRGITVTYTIEHVGGTGGTAIYRYIGSGTASEDEGKPFEELYQLMETVNPALLAEPIGISSIKTICSREELHKADNVLLSCLTSIAPSTSVDATDARCFGAGYDPDSISIEYAIEATTRSANDWWINPLERRGDKTIAGIPTTREFVVEEKTVNGKTFGYFELSDLYAGCNSVIVSIGEDCRGYYLEPLSTPRITDVAQEEFITLYNPNDDFGGTYLNKNHIGKTVLVTYDAEREVEHIIADDSKLNSFEVEFIVPVTGQTNNKQEWIRFYALITEHSVEYNTTDEASLSLTAQVIRRNGRFYDKYIVE